MLKNSAIDLGEPGFDSTFGYGLVNPGSLYICDCEGNFDGDADVDSYDAATFKIYFGRSTMQRPCTNVLPCSGDFTCDTDVDSFDAAIFKTDLGRSSMGNPCNTYCAGQVCAYP